MAALIAVGVVGHSSVAFAQVRTTHPRIYLSNERRLALRTEGTTNEILSDLDMWMTRRLTPAGMTAADADMRGNYPDLLVIPAAFTATVLRTPTYITEVRRYLVFLAGIAPDLTNDETGTRNRLYSMSLGYDWMYDDLTPEEKTTLQNAIASYVENLATRIDTPNFVEGTSRWGNVTAFAGALAIHGDDSRLDATLTTILDSWRNGYNPALAYMGEGGGHPMGWMYGPAYSDYAPYFMWRTASSAGEVWMEDFFRDSAYFHIYAANGVNDFPLFGDCWAARLQPNSFNQMLMSSRMFGNGYAETAIQNAIPSMQPTELYLELITGDTPATPRAFNTLPLSRFFPGSGFFVVRDQWDAPSDVALAVFKAAPYYTKGHNHRDEGSLVLDYRGRLLLDAGEYDSPHSTHDNNFYGRSVAHNVLLVEWDAESMPSGFARDYGQRIEPGIPHTVEDLQNTYRRTGMTVHADNAECVWARADLADVYNEGKLSSYTRDFLEMRRSDASTLPVIYVLDRATLPVARPAEILWHFAEAATVTGNHIDGSNPGGAHVRIDTLLPADAVFTPYSGDARWTAAGVQYPPVPLAVTVPPHAPRVPSPYWGRVEVAVATTTTTPTWSTLIRVGDSAFGDSAVTPTSLVGADWTGARLGSTLFVVASETTSQVNITDAAPAIDGCIVGLAPNADVTVAFGSGSPLLLHADSNGIATVDPTADTDAGVQPDAGMNRDGGTMTMDGGNTELAALQPNCSCDVVGAERANSAWMWFAFGVGVIAVAARFRSKRSRGRM